MDNCILRIEKLENGYEVEVYDQATADENRKPKNERWFSWILALVVALLSAEWLARKLLRLA